jgi:hypothetical protein
MSSMRSERFNRRQAIRMLGLAGSTAVTCRVRADPGALANRPAGQANDGAHQPSEGPSGDRGACRQARDDDGGWHRGQRCRVAASR